MTLVRGARGVVLAVFFAAAGVVLSLFIGASSGFDPQIFWILRVPRTICAVAVGGGLAVAGTLVQAGLGNPLADPFTLGVASAAALGAVVGSVFFGGSLLGSGAFAFLFAMGGLALLALWLRQRFRHATEVLLAGVVAGLFFSSLATVIMALADPAAWTSAMGWLLGRLESLSVAQSVTALLLVVTASAMAWLHWKPLDLIAVDELAAESAGVDVAGFRKRLFLLSAVLTAICVAVAGVIGFLGLIVPHVLRKLGLQGHRALIPAAFLSGAGLLAVSDVGARLIAQPSELPVGVVMAMLGAPVFLLLVRGKKDAAS